MTLNLSDVYKDYLLFVHLNLFPLISLPPLMLLLPGLVPSGVFNKEMWKINQTFLVRNLTSVYIFTTMDEIRYSKYFMVVL